MGLAGSGMLVRSITNVGPLEGMGLDPAAPGITLQKTTTFDAPVERVFDLLVNPEKLPRVMDHVREVTKVDDTHYHWTVIGPVGTPLSWDSEITRIIPNELLAWRSSPGAAVKNDGVVQFQSTENGGTRVHIPASPAVRRPAAPEAGVGRVGSTGPWPPAGRAAGDRRAVDFGPSALGRTGRHRGSRRPGQRAGGPLPGHARLG